MCVSMRGGITQNDTARVDNSKRVGHAHHTIFIHIGRVADICKAAQIDIGMVDNDVVGTLDGGQRTGGRCHFTIGFVTCAVFLQ